MSIPVESAPPPLIPPAAPAAGFAAERETAERLIAGRARIESELAKVIVGQREVIEQILIALLAGALLITGAPGLAKTLLVKSIAQVFHLKFPAFSSRPTSCRRTSRAPRYCRTTVPAPAADVCARPVRQHDPRRRNQPHAAEDPKRRCSSDAGTQVTASGSLHPLEEPFFVLATQNPSKWKGRTRCRRPAGRFISMCMDYLPERTEVKVVTQTTAGRPSAIDALSPARTCCDFTNWSARCRSRKKWSVMRCSSRRHRARIRRHARLSSTEWVSWGAGTRAGQFLILGAKVARLRGEGPH